MSINSYYTLRFTFPVSTEVTTSLVGTNNKRVHGAWVTCDGSVYTVDDEGSGFYSIGLLDWVIDLFGKPLDEVPGLHLELGYECYEEDPFACTLRIDDGKVDYEEATMCWKKAPMSECFIAIG